MPTPKRYQSKDGTITWRVRFRDGSSSASETFITRKHAQDFCDLVAAAGGARARAIIREAEPDAVLKHTVGEIVDRWFEWKDARYADGRPKRVRSPYTLTRYEQLIRLHIKPHLGDKLASVVSESDVQEWIDKLTDKLAPKTVIECHSLLHQVYKWANAPSRGLAVVDPCTATDLPKAHRKRVKGITPAEWKVLHEAAREVDPDAADLLLFLVSTGWRWSEAVAVRVMDVVDFDEGGVFVSMGRVLRRDGNSFYYVEGEGKSAAATRRVKLGSEAAAMVRRRIEGRPATSLLLTNRRGSKWSYSAFHSDVWTATKLKSDGPRTRKRILQVAHEKGLDRAPTFELHMLRHTHAVLMLLTGESLASVQKRLGHESIETTIGTYGTMVGDVTDAGLDKLDAILGGTAEISGMRVLD